MAQTPKSLAQIKPAAGSLADAYTVAAATRAVLSSAVICNMEGRPAKFSIAHAVNGLTAEDKHYLYFERVIPAKETYTITLGVCMNAADILRVYSDSGELVFNIYGLEVT